ncbi:UNKNOWN [Stylonychia lemnae]|uniref:RING-type domain-containing protein n=1 Tax=Stylonychia lemnae TaxID=5949 RepID=A0A078AG87_STYLE|nr:UNKNOWN [Stylonychia lemnae]|eukprot:CDW80846.1 UNKNOWN [Stylonychia lemnae]
MKQMELITLDRVVNIKQTDAIEHLCYLCNAIAIDPRRCCNSNPDSSKCEALYCFCCLRQYLQSKPFCPKCRQPTMKDQFKRPAFEFWKFHQTGIMVQCQFQNDVPKEEKEKYFVIDCSVYNLENIFEHQMKCQLRLVDCQICFKKIPSYKSGPEHQKKDCLMKIRENNSDVQAREGLCLKCYQPLSSEHNCVKSLMERVSVLKSTVLQQNLTIQDQIIGMSETQQKYYEVFYNRESEKQIFKNVQANLSDFRDFLEDLKVIMRDQIKQESLIVQKRSNESGHVNSNQGASNQELDIYSRLQNAVSFIPMKKQQANTNQN